MKLQKLHYVIEDYMYSLSKIFNYYESYSSEIPYKMRYDYIGNAKALEQIAMLEGLAYQLCICKKANGVQFKLKVYERNSINPYDLQEAVDLTPIVESSTPLGGHTTLNSCISFNTWFSKCNKEIAYRLFNGKGNTMVVENDKSLVLNTSLREWSGDEWTDHPEGKFLLQLGDEDEQGFRPLTLSEYSRDISLSWEYNWTCNFNINPYILYRSMLLLDASKIKVSIKRYENEKMKRVYSITKEE